MFQRLGRQVKLTTLITYCIYSIYRSRIFYLKNYSRINNSSHSQVRYKTKILIPDILLLETNWSDKKNIQYVNYYQNSTLQDHYAVALKKIFSSFEASTPGHFRNHSHKKEFSFFKTWTRKTVYKRKYNRISEFLGISSQKPLHEGGNSVTDMEIQVAYNHKKESGTYDSWVKASKIWDWRYRITAKVNTDNIDIKIREDKPISDIIQRIVFASIVPNQLSPKPYRLKQSEPIYIEVQSVKGNFL